MEVAAGGLKLVSCGSRAPAVVAGGAEVVPDVQRARAAGRARAARRALPAAAARRAAAGAARQAAAARLAPRVQPATESANLTGFITRHWLVSLFSRGLSSDSKLDARILVYS